MFIMNSKGRNMLSLGDPYFMCLASETVPSMVTNSNCIRLVRLAFNNVSLVSKPSDQSTVETLQLNS